MTDNHIILLAHGSRDPQWRKPMEDLAEGLKSALNSEAIHLAYLERAEPELPTAIEHAVQAGAEIIRVIPLFLSSRGHVLRDVGPQVSQARQQHDLPIELMPAIGEMAEFADMLRLVVGRLL
jgi:sirohydrochlorin cobaltochelatase